MDDQFILDKELFTLTPLAEFPIKLGLLQQISIQMTRPAVQFPVADNYPVGRAAGPPTKSIGVRGLIMDDKKWGTVVGQFTEALDTRTEIKKRLEKAFELGKLCEIEEPSIGLRKNYLITSLTIMPSADYKNCDEVSLQLNKMRRVKNYKVEGGSSEREFSDPYEFY